MVIRFWFGYLHAGRGNHGFGDNYDASITLCLGWRGDVPTGELQWRRTYRFSWDWLPQYRYLSLIPTTTVSLPPTITDMLVGNFDGHLIETTARGIDSMRWTGRDRKFLGFGRWRREFTSIRSTWRSKMKVYLTGEKERANPNHVMYLTPAAALGSFMSKNDVPEEWMTWNTDGTGRVPKMFEIPFIFGCAEVNEKIGEYLIATKQAQRTNLIRAASGPLLGSLAGMIAGR